ncbi:acyl carrier protein [Streptomyces sp. 8N706]|uniref:acyl carrier protein n=1 Tax=Streptomyces sp. 8N706 TaxID=3457416 RepID=UPI003FD6A713
MTAAALLTTLQEEALALDPDAVRRAALDYLIALIREGLELDATEPVPDDRPIGELGVDSLLALEIGDRIAGDIGVHLSAETLADQPTLLGLAELLARELPARPA